MELMRTLVSKLWQQRDDQGNVWMVSKHFLNGCETPEPVWRREMNRLCLYGKLNRFDVRADIPCSLPWDGNQRVLHEWTYTQYLPLPFYFPKWV